MEDEEMPDNHPNKMLYNVVPGFQTWASLQTWKPSTTQKMDFQKEPYYNSIHIYDSYSSNILLKKNKTKLDYFF